jgi:tetratricopeptide (TPR) repeat protein
MLISSIISGCVTQRSIGFACLKKNQIDKAKEAFLKALDLDPNNSFAMRNLGGLWGKSGDNVRALYFLQRANELNPDDPFTVYGLAVTYQDLGDMEGADRHFRKVLGMEAPSQLQSLAKDGLREIAAKTLKEKGFRADAVLYLLKALKLYNNMPLQEVQRISFEIGMMGQSGLDINNPEKKYALTSLKGIFTGLQLICYMYAGFRLLSPEMDIGVDLSEEYKIALGLFNDKGSKWDLN